MRKVKEVLDENDCVNQLFDDEFVGKILDKNEELLSKILGKKDDEFFGKILKKKDDEFMKNMLLEKGNDSTVNIIMQLLKESSELKKKIQQELKNEE